MAEQLRDAGLDPLTWAFARLLGQQLRSDVQELPGLPSSHAWRPLPGDVGPARVLTKARCLGVVVSVLPRAERVEFLVDDGSALVKTVLWGPPERVTFRLGDLVEVEGKLNAITSVDGADPDHPRELRVTRMSTVDDPNEELLHWLQVAQLTRAYYTKCEAAGPETTRPETIAARTSRQSASAGERWEKVGREAFFHLRVSPDEVGDDQRERVLLGVLGRLVRQQTEVLGDATAERRAVRVTFVEVLRGLSSRDVQASSAASDQRAAIRDLRFAFHTLRSAGLLFLEDEDADVHELLSYELALRPAIVAVVSDRPTGTSLADVVDALTSRRRFERVPLLWIEQGFRQAVEDGAIQQRSDSHVVYPALMQRPGSKSNETS